MKNFEELIKSSYPVLVDFYADWCAPCKAMAPELEKLAGEVGDKAKIIKINVDKNPAVATQYRIQGIPTLILFQDGEIKWRQSGATTASQLKKVIDQYVVA